MQAPAAPHIETVNATIAALARHEREPFALDAQATQPPPPSPERINFAPINEQCLELLKLYRIFEQAKLAYTVATKATASRANVEPATIHKLIRASANGTYAKARRLIDQQAVVFERIGQINQP